MESIVAILQARQREADLAEIDAQRVGITKRGKVGPDPSSKSDAAMIALSHLEEDREALALAARRGVDQIERHVDAGSRSLVAAVEQLVSKDLVAVARQALAVDRALVKIADERARAARASTT
jgi:hypothetical protein